MQYGNLYEMITYLQKGTKMHIGVLFFGNYGNSLCELPHKQQIHSGEVCEEFKTRGEKGYRRCFACRNLALKKALCTKRPFGGYCINGVYEYTHPVIVAGEVACVIFIGNILGEVESVRSNLATRGYLLDTMERTLSQHDCVVIARLLEGHMRFLLEKGKENEERSDLLIQNIKNYIQSNLEFDVDISNISELFHYNEQYLGRWFKKELGCSIKIYICRRRIENAKKLLCETGDSVISIAARTGFT